MTNGTTTIQDTFYKASGTTIIKDIFYITLIGTSAEKFNKIKSMFAAVAAENYSTEYLATWPVYLLYKPSTNPLTIKFGYKRSDDEFGLTDREIDDVIDDLSDVIVRAGRRVGL